MFSVIIIPWQLDALFFTFQCLATDLHQIIDMVRLYCHNKAINNKEVYAF